MEVKNHFLLIAGFFFLMVGLSPSNAEACSKGYYGLTTCLPCPAGTYAYKDRIITRLGCKRCPAGKNSTAGSRSCYSQCLAGMLTTRGGFSAVYVKVGSVSQCLPKKGYHYKNVNGRCVPAKACATKGCRFQAVGEDCRYKEMSFSHNEGYYNGLKARLGRGYVVCRFGHRISSRRAPAGFRFKKGATTRNQWRSFHCIPKKKPLRCRIGYQLKHSSCVKTVYSRAQFHKKRGCQAGTFFDPRKGGECWSCPKGYRRTIHSLVSAKACQKPVRPQWSRVRFRSRYHHKRGCPAGTFFDSRTDACWSCPKDYKRTIYSLASTKACQKLLPPWSRARYHYKSGCARGTFLYPRGGGECWSCPRSYKRNKVTVTHAKACFKTLYTKPTR